MKIDLPDGEWAVLVDVDTVTSGQRKKLMRFIGDSDDPYDTNDRVVSELVQQWSLDLPLPTRDDMSSLDDLPFATADELTKACIQIVKQLTPDFDPNPDPASPTVPSAASGG